MELAAHEEIRIAAPPKAVLRLPDLEHAKSAVLNSLASPNPDAPMNLQSSTSSTGIAESPGLGAIGIAFLAMGAEGGVRNIRHEGILLIRVNTRDGEWKQVEVRKLLKGWERRW
jgi:hypothetical protein